VLDRWPDTAEAREGLRWLAVAEDQLPEPVPEDPRELAAALWKAREAFPDAKLAGRFRRAVVLRLLWVMESTGVGGPSELPCRAEVLLEAGHAEAAIRWLSEALGTLGARSDLRRLLGLALWRSEHPKEARRQWLAWLLETGPEEAAELASTLPDPVIARLVAAHGADRAPAEAWLAGLAPLLQEDELPGRPSPHLELHRHLLGAEDARRRGGLDAAVRHREALLRLDPGLLRRYMDRLA